MKEENMKLSGFAEQTKPIFRKKAKTKKKVTLRLDCILFKRKRINVIKR